MNKLKLLFKKPDHTSKSFFWFTWFTIISLIIGLAVKIYVIETAGEGLSHIMNADVLGNAKTGKIVSKSEVLTEDLSMLILQILIVALTLWVYPKSIHDQLKVMAEPGKKMSRKMYKSFKKEYIIFLAIFLFLDVASIGTLFYEKAKLGFDLNFQLWFTIISIVIPTPLAITSLVWLRKLRATDHTEFDGVKAWWWTKLWIYRKAESLFKRKSKVRA